MEIQLKRRRSLIEWITGAPATIRIKVSPSGVPITPIKRVRSRMLHYNRQRKFGRRNRQHIHGWMGHSHARSL